MLFSNQVPFFHFSLWILVNQSDPNFFTSQYSQPGPSFWGGACAGVCPLLFPSCLAAVPHGISGRKVEEIGLQWLSEFRCLYLCQISVTHLPLTRPRIGNPYIGRIREVYSRWAQAIPGVLVNPRLCNQYHRLGDSNNRHLLFTSHSLEAGNLRSRCGQGWILLSLPPGV